MSTEVGAVHYSVAMDTTQMVRGQRDVDTALKKTTSSFDGFGAKLSQITSAITVYAAAMALVKSAQMADDMRLLAARVDVAAGSVDAGSVAMGRLVAISRQTQTAVDGNVEVFTRLNASIVAMGGTQNDTLRITELLGKAIKVSGASAIEGKSAMVQFGQALGSGKLAGDELRSLLETAPYLMKQLATGLGVPIGALKQLGEDGKLTADVVTNALSKAATQIEADFAKFPQTVGGALDVALDAANRANEKFDQLSGTSTALTGVTKGFGEVLDKLADQFGAANTEAGTLGRNEKIKSWAEATKVVLSYVVDAADFVTRGFKQMGIGLGGLAASAGAVLEGNFSGAKAILGSLLGDIKAVNSEALAGKQMRDLWNAGAGGGRGSVNPEAAPSTLKADSKGDDGKAKKKAADEARQLATRRLAAQEYLEGLVADNKTALAKIDAEEQKALTDNDKRRVADGKNAEIYAKARVEIQKKYATERTKLAEKDAEDLAELEERNARARADAAILLTTSTEQRILLIRDEAVREAEAAYVRGKATFEEMEAAKLRAAVKAAEDQKALQRDRDAFALGTLDMKASRGGLADQENAVVARAAAETAAVEALRQLDLENSAMYAARKVEIERGMQEEIAALRNSANQTALGSASAISESLLSVLKNTAGEQSGIYKAMFAASKAFAIAESIVKIQAGLADAASKPWPLNLAAMASVAAATAGIVSTIQGTHYGGGRQYGGPVGADSYYRVNEGNRPEMFQAANGDQFLMPNRSGQVIPADKAGGSGALALTVIIENNGAPMRETGRSYDSEQRIVRIAVQEVASQISSNSGPVWSAMRSSTNAGPKLS